MPKKCKMQRTSMDIRPFFKKSDNPGSSSSSTTESTEPGGAAASQPDGATGSKTFTRSQVKKENDGDSTDGHLHHFNVKFSRTDRYKYPISCDQPRTVLQAIQSTVQYNKKMKECLDEKIVIQLGKGDMTFTVATHFPCSFIPEGESLIITCESEKVEEAQDKHDKPINVRDKYSVFYIDTVGGLHTKQKKLFRSNAVKQFKYLCVYGEKGMTVEEALKRDGRFIDDLGDFTLSHNENPNCITERTQKVDNLDEKEFKIRLPRNKRANDEKQQENPGASNNAQHRCDTTPVLDLVCQRGTSVKTAVEKSGSDTEEIYQMLRQQFPGLKEWMESRFPGDSYQEALKLRKEDFGKIQQSFSEVHRVRKLLKLGESVGKVVVGTVRQGTGFVLFDNFILTNAHILKDCVEGEATLKLKEGVEVFVLFNYDDPEPHTNFYYFPVKTVLVSYSEGDLDYAILELDPEGGKPNQTTQRKQMKVPPGLLKEFGQLPSDGEACIISHPAGGVKKMDPTCIIAKEKREQAVNHHLHLYQDNFIVQSIRDMIINQGIENIMMGENKAENVATYNTFMYHGSSGSPVFDAHGRVFGLHTGGYVYECQNHTESVIEFAQPLLTIFEHFVGKLKDSRKVELLKRLEKVVKSNGYLKKVLNPKASDTGEPADPDERSDSDESMEIDND